jgi:hypothetical protein
MPSITTFVPAIARTDNSPDDPDTFNPITS